MEKSVLFRGDIRVSTFMIKIYMYVFANYRYGLPNQNAITVEQINNLRDPQNRVQTVFRTVACL